MAITYPLALPTTSGIRRITLAAESVVAISQSIFTFQTQVQEHQGQRWRVGVTLPPMKRVDAEAWNAFLLSLNGRQGTFLLGDIGGTAPRGSALGTPLVNGASQTGQSIITDGWTVSSTGVLLVGDYIQFGSGATTRMYKVLKDVDSDGGGNATIDIWPRLRESPAENESLVLNDTKGTFRLAQNISTWDLNVAAYYGVGFEAEEAV